MPNFKDFLPLPPWEGPPLPRKFIAQHHSNPGPLEEVTEFVNQKLGTNVNPSLIIETKPIAKYIAIRGSPPEEKIFANVEYFPKDEAGQKTVLLHEVAEIAYSKKEPRVEEPHISAEKFEHEHWPEIGGRDPKELHEELIKRGYYYG